jgi:TolB-like protein
MRPQHRPTSLWPLCLALLALQPLAASAAPAGKSLAVLEFKSKLAKADADVGYLTDVVRTAAKDALPSLKVMTRESLLVLLEATGKKMEECEGECEVDTGRRLGADLVISGEVLKFGTKLKINMKMHDTHDGALLSGAQVSGRDLDELDKNLGAAVLHLLEPLGAKKEEMAPPPPAISSRSEQQYPPAPAPDRRSEQRAEEPAAAPAPEPEETGSKVSFGAFLSGGYNSFKVEFLDSSGSTLLDGSISGITYSLSGQVLYRIARRWRLGAFAQFNSMEYEDPSVGGGTAGSAGNSTSKLLAIAVGGMGSYSYGPLDYWAAIGLNAFNQNLGTGAVVMIGVDLPFLRILALRALLAARNATRSLTVGNATDLRCTVTSLELGGGLKF